MTDGTGFLRYFFAENIQYVDERSTLFERRISAYLIEAIEKSYAEIFVGMK